MLYHFVSHVSRIFGYEGQEAEDVTYVNWLSLLWNGVAKATEMFQPSTKTWLQVLGLRKSFSIFLEKKLYGFCNIRISQRFSQNFARLLYSLFR